MYVSSVTPELVQEVVARIAASFKEEEKFLTIEDREAGLQAVADFERLVREGDQRLSKIADTLLVKIGTFGQTEFNADELGISLGETWYVTSLIEKVLHSRYLYAAVHRKQITVHHILFKMPVT